MAQREHPASAATEAHEEALARRWPWLLPLAAGAVLILVVRIIAG